MLKLNYYSVVKLNYYSIVLYVLLCIIVFRSMHIESYNIYIIKYINPEKTRDDR